jgi:ribose transport system substrate-binding protein
MARTRRGRRWLVVAAALLCAGLTAVTAGASALADGASPAQEIAKAGMVNVPFCGTKPMTLAVLDGVGANPWSLISYAAVKTEAAKCKNVKVTSAAGNLDLQKSISDINTAVAQGADAIVVIPDFGVAELPAIKQATAQGVKVVPWGADPGGKAGVDYVSYVDWNPGYAGKIWAEWMVKALHGKGNVIYTGGPAGNPVGAEQLAGVVKVFAKHKGMHLLTGNSSWPVTNWDPATAQKVTAALLSRYPKIDGVISNYGADGLAVMRAFEAAGRKLIPMATLTANGVSCAYKKSGVPLATISGRNWLGRVAARKAIAAAQGIKNTEPSLFNLPFYEDTLAKNKPLRCNPSKSLASDFDVSNRLSPAQIAKFGKP